MEALSAKTVCAEAPSILGHDLYANNPRIDGESPASNVIPITRVTPAPSIGVKGVLGMPVRGIRSMSGLFAGHNSGRAGFMDHSSPVVAVPHKRDLAHADEVLLGTLIQNGFVSLSQFIRNLAGGSICTKDDRAIFIRAAAALEKRRLKPYEDEFLKAFGLATTKYARYLPPEAVEGLQARALLILHNLSLVDIITKMRRQGSNYDELIAEGRLGLIRAVDGYDPNKGTHFVTYAPDWIRQSQNRFFETQGRSIRLPYHKQQFLKHIDNARHYLQSKLRRKATSGEIALFMGITLDELKSVLAEESDTVALSLQAPLHEHEHGSRSLENVVGTEKDSPLNRLMGAGQMNLHEKITAVVMQHFGDRECQIILNRLGLLDPAYGVMTLREMGPRLGISYQTVLNTENKIMPRLYDLFLENGIISPELSKDDFYEMLDACRSNKKRRGS